MTARKKPQKATKAKARPKTKAARPTPADPLLSFDVEIPSTDGEAPLSAEAEAALARLQGAPAETPPADDAPQEAPAGVSLTGALVPVWRIIDRLVTRAAGPDYALSAEEIADLAGASDAVLDRYLPAILCAHGELVALVLAIGGIYAGKQLAAQIAAEAETVPAADSPADMPEDAG